MNPPMTPEEVMRQQELMLQKMNPELLKKKTPSAKLKQNVQHFDSTQLEKKEKPTYNSFE